MTPDKMIEYYKNKIIQNLSEDDTKILEIYINSEVHTTRDGN